MSYHKFIAFIVFSLAITICSIPANAAPNDYLQYQEPQPVAPSAFSTFSYVFSLIITFAVVIGLAYLTSKFLGKRIGKLGLMQDNRILISFPLGTNKSVQVIEVAGKYLILGVTEQNINLLTEITEPHEIEKLKSVIPIQQTATPFEQVFENHLASLQTMSQKFPAVFKLNSDHNNDKEGKR